MPKQSTHVLNEQEQVVKKQIVIQATPDKVWDALTNPDLTKKYFFGCKVHSDWKKGSDIHFERKFLWMKIDLHGKILQVEPGHILQYTLVNSKSGDADDPANQSLVTDELVYKNGATTLSISDDVGSAEGFEKRYKKSEKGWDKVLAGLKKVVEG